jgi:hypothetical protein
MDHSLLIVSKNSDPLLPEMLVLDVDKMGMCASDFLPALESDWHKHNHYKSFYCSMPSTGKRYQSVEAKNKSGNPHDGCFHFA